MVVPAQLRVTVSFVFRGRRESYLSRLRRGLRQHAQVGFLDKARFFGAVLQDESLMGYPLEARGTFS